MPETVVHFQVRMPPALHEHLAGRARDEKISLNALVVGLLREAAGRREESSDGVGVQAVIPVR
jgi:predicted HicB family RNase H-like nuclease